MSKINTDDVNTSSIQLSSLFSLSFSEINERYKDVLSWGECRYLYRSAQQENKNNTLSELHILSRANPQLHHSIRLAIANSPLQRSYDDLFERRAQKFVSPDSVASMFSPAGYLTELYREARDLHAADSRFSLKKRRPDLEQLALSQANLDKEISTLSLSNQILLDNCMATLGVKYEVFMEQLSTYRETGDTPFHQPYETIRETILLKDNSLSAFSRNPDVAELIDINSLLAVQANISPELYLILSEEITEANAAELYKKNFGDRDVNFLMNIESLAEYYGLSIKEMVSLTSLLGHRDYSSPEQYYRNDTLTALVIDDTGATGEIDQIVRSYGDNSYQIHYAELFPQGGNQYLLNFSFTDNRSGSFAIGTGGYGTQDLFYAGDFEFVKNQHISLPVQIPADNVKNGVEIGFTRVGGGYYSTVSFKQTSVSPRVFILNLNKIIRLYKASGLSPEQVYLIAYNKVSDEIFNPDVLQALFLVEYYTRRYAIDVTDALVLGQGNISRVSVANQTSFFDTLFNTPLINGISFSADDVSVNWNSDVAEDIARISILKRAFQVTESELQLVWRLLAGESTVLICSIENISALYFGVLLARLHGISVAELVALLSISPWSTTPLNSLDAANKIKLVEFVYRITSWIAQQGWSVADVYLMLTKTHSTVITQEIENLIATLRSGMGGHRETGTALLAQIAPFIAAAVQLNSSDSAKSLLLWVDQLKPQGLTTETFIDLVLKDDISDQETKDLVAFCQVLGQLSLAVRLTGISPPVLSLMISSPQLFQQGLTSLPWDLTLLFALTQIHDAILKCGENASQVIRAFSEGVLTPQMLAEAISKDPLAMSQALNIVRGGDAETYKDWAEIGISLQWMDISETLGCSPDTIAALFTLRYINVTAEAQPAYSEWVSVSNMIQAGLSQADTATLYLTLDELISTSLCAYYIKLINMPEVIDRDSLYSWLLIDNQVSGKIKTTAIGEAIASVQLYVNRTLNGLEPGESLAVKSRQFFKDWDTYNKNYSSWAGVSELVYFPENYVDPTVRIGQTDMMDEMLQTLGQSQLSVENVESAFKTYMSRFERVANLDVISGYHDNLSTGEGTTYFIGKGILDGEKYYWRSLQQHMLDYGKYPANAWGQWKEIGTAISAWRNIIRPVVFNRRLYIFWIEKQVAAVSDGSSVSETSEYVLKQAFIKHDGTWSVPVVYSFSDAFIADDMPSFADVSMSAINEDDLQFVLLFYKPAATEDENKSNPCSGMIVSADNEIHGLAESDAAIYRNFIWKQFDLTGCKRISKFYSKDAYSMGVNFSWTHDIASDNGSGGVRGGKLTLKSLTVDSDSVDLLMDASLRYIPTIYDQTTTYANLIKRYGQNGDVFYLKSGVPWSVIYPAIRINGTTKELICYSSENRTSLYCVYTNPDDIATAFSMTIPADGGGYYRAAISQDFSLDSGMFFIMKSETDDTDTVFLTDPYDKISLGAENNKVGLSFSYNAVKEEHLASSDIPSDQLPDFSLSEMIYPYTGVTLSVPLDVLATSTNSTIEVSVRFFVLDAAGGVLGEQNGTFRLRQVVLDNDQIISLYRQDNGSQYLQLGCYRTRINTLFARQLVARADLGLNAVLSMETQLLPEPKLGKGSYVTITFPAYDAAVHGTNANVTLSISPFSSQNSATEYIFWSGVLQDSPLQITLFVPTSQISYGDPVQFPEDRNNGLAVFLTCQMGNYYQGVFNNITQTDLSLTGFTASTSAVAARDVKIVLAQQNTEPMDFSGANALYFWEMFFYVPSMVFLRLLQESRYEEATRWMKFIWSPEGYLGENGEKTTWTWNVRPLEEDTSWNASPLDSVDPDAVSQSDPMHYKVATFMRALDLLIARGDDAYRRLERDSLNEAKMWYAQALNILGKEPYDALLKGGWSDPVLSDAASQTLQASYQQHMLWVRTPDLSGVEERTANTLTGLFYPQQNEKLTGYWQTLAQRLYNLRHNLSIDGQPLSLPLYATPADPASLLSAAVLASEGGGDLPSVTDIPLFRFPVLLETARATLNQLMQFGNQILTLTERQDAEALSELLQTQGAELARNSILQQDKNIAEIDADREALEESRRGALDRRDSYSHLYDENVNAGETQAMELYLASSVTAAVGTGLQMGAAALDMVPNIYGLAVGGSRYGALFNAFAIGTQIASDGTRIAADKISQSEMYRRRRQEWEIQRNNAEAEIKLIDSQLASLTVRREAAVLQKSLAEMQQAQTQAQQVYLQNKFSSKALYNWLRGKLAGIYYQFYDIAVTRCLMAQRAWQWRFNDNSASFIRPGAWQGTYAGLLSGETLMLNLAQMEQAWYAQEERLLEVNKTVSLSAVYSGLSSGAFSFADKVTEIITAGSGTAGSGGNTVEITSGQLVATIKLSDLNIRGDYPDALGATRRIKQISVTLPALVGPYQDVRAVLSYSGSVVLPKGCSAIVVSHGMNDSGIFQLDFNDPQHLPFEGIPVDDTGGLTLSFPDSAGKQKALLMSLNDIIVHIRYTIGQ
ncbi:neuraminidase-like domain-containing protein [Trabulsiella odontotermitis]|uniref:Toxin n=1 Tax=Trabulsiella odontotermitis TaxID=379893 RepID=A0A0L0GZB0_9ENTR|nr:neuraminidase-like domain-containing protein [Trabulsiella odontotermitis]KNC93808.1 hypothetical protein GM31_17845 [Trabulsiella odontotermitis]